MRFFAPILATILLSPSLVAAQSVYGGAEAAVDLAERAITKGYGTSCSLSMVPSTTDAYYPCIDFGPYRYVREYQKVSAYVIRPGEKPFKIMGGTKTRPEFIVGGPWEENLAQQAVGFWNDIIDGGKTRNEQNVASSKAKKDAEEFIRKTIEPVETPVAAAKPSAPVVNSDKVTGEELTNRDSNVGQSMGVDENDIRKVLSQSKN